jgi:predicted alpha/beta hydrolase family esterase
VVIAQDDQVMPPERSRALAAAIGAEVVVHPESGHALVAEDPVWVGEAVHRFLARIDAGIPDVLESPRG